MLPFLRPKLKDGWMSLSFAKDTVDLAHIRRRREEKPEVLLLNSSPCAIDVVDDVRALSKALGLSRYRCNALLRLGEYQLLQVEPPDVVGEEMKEALRWRIKDLLHYPVEEATIDVLEIPSDPSAVGRAKQVFAVVAHNTLLAPRVELFDEAKLPLATIDIPELAQRNISALFEAENRGLALLAFDDNGSMLTFTFQGELYAVRQSDIPLAQLLEADGERLGQLLERIALEAQRSLDNFDRLYGHINVPRLLVSPLPEVPGFLEQLRKDISLPVEELDLGEVLNFSATPELAQPALQTRYLKALGAALRD